MSKGAPGLGLGARGLRLWMGEADLGLRARMKKVLEILEILENFRKY